MFKSWCSLLIVGFNIAFAVEVDVSLSGESIEKSAPVAPNRALEVTLQNQLARPVDIYWIENAAREVLVVPNLRAGASTPMNTYAGHGFFFAEKDKVSRFQFPTSLIYQSLACM
jgi:hypothetical protein